MPFPFINKHSEKQYLELENNYLNLYSFLESLLAITEGEDLNSDSHRLSHFNALCKRINEGVERFNPITKQVRDSKFKGDSATTSSHPDPATVILMWLTHEDHKLIIESLENYSLMLNEYKVSDNLNKLANQIKELKNGKSK